MPGVQVIKYAVIHLDCVESNVNILNVFDDMRDAVKYMNESIDETEEFNNSNYIKKYHDNIKQISIYKANFIYPNP